MPYISRVFQQVKEDHEEYVRDCLREQANGNIPVIVMQGRLTLRVYVSPETTVEYILNTFQDEKIKNIKDIKNILYLTYNHETREYIDGKVIKDFGLPLQALSSDRIKLLIQLNPESHPL